MTEHITNILRDLKMPLACLVGSLSLSAVNDLLSTLAIGATLVYTVIRIVKELRKERK